MRKEENCNFVVFGLSILNIIIIKLNLRGKPFFPNFNVLCVHILIRCQRSPSDPCATSCNHCCCDTTDPPSPSSWNENESPKKTARSIPYLLSSKSIQEKISKGPVPIIVPPITVAPVSELGTGFSHLKYKSSHWNANWKTNLGWETATKHIKKIPYSGFSLYTFHINAFSYLCIHFTEVLIIL